VARLAAWQQRKLEARNLVARELLGHLDVRTLPTGMHAWLTLPRPWRAAALVERIGAQGVLATPAETFATGWSPAPQAIRISLGGAVAGIDVLRAGLELILATLNEKVTGNFNGF
jgi:DNA-binding transcriptional MocR family regulator